MAFEFPAIYSFPPFWTCQRNESLEIQRLSDWSQLILSYCAHHKLTELTLSNALESPLFNNEKLQRRLTEQEARVVIDSMVVSGNAEWLDEQHLRCLILSKSWAEWSSLVYAYIDRTGQQGSVLTVYELTSGDDTSDEPFYGIDEDLMIKILKFMEVQGKAKLFSVGTSQGVKFV